MGKTGSRVRRKRTPGWKKNPAKCLALKLMDFELRQLTVNAGTVGK